MVKYIIWLCLPLFTIKYLYLAILAIVATICVIIYPYFAKYNIIWPYFSPYLETLTYEVISTPVGHTYHYCGNVPTLCVLMLKLCAKLESNRTITFGVIALLRMGIQL